MVRKKKRVVRRPAKSTKGTKHVKKKRSRNTPNKRPQSQRGRVVKTRARAAPKRPKSKRKTAARKLPPRSGRPARLDPQRAELLLEKISRKIEKAKRPADIRRYSKQLADLLRERRSLGFTTSFREEMLDDQSPPDTPTRPTDSGAFREDDDDEELEEFHGPIGDTYDDDFANIDWDSRDWDEIIDEIGDEELDSYGEDAK